MLLRQKISDNVVTRVVSVFKKIAGVVFSYADCFRGDIFYSEFKFLFLAENLRCRRPEDQEQEEWIQLTGTIDDQEI